MSAVKLFKKKATSIGLFIGILKLPIVVFIILSSVEALARKDTSIAQQQYTLATMPRVDIHAHFGNTEQIDGILKTGEVLRNRYHINLEVWVNLNPFLPVLHPVPLSVAFLDTVEYAYQGRILSCISDYDVTNGLRYSPEELVAWKNRGVVGYKIWAPVITGPVPPDEDKFTIYAPDYAGLDQPANDPTWETMARIGMVCSSIHIGQAHPRRWNNPVHFWTAIHAWERVLEKNPDMVSVIAHMFNLFYSNEQLDYLRYIMERYPNVYLDIGGRFGDFNSMDRERLRNFIIQYADRILFGTDVSSQAENGEYDETAERYYRCFQGLETDKICTGFFSEKNEYRGLALPVDVLEKIYFRNAIKVYPRIQVVLENMGYMLP